MLLTTDTPALLDTTPFWVLWGMVILNTAWMVINMVYIPEYGLVYLNPEFTKQSDPMPIKDFLKHLFDDFFYVGYFALWVVFLLVGFVSFISYPIALLTWNTGFIEFWTASFGFWGSTVPMAAPYVFVILHIADKKKNQNWEEYKGAIFLQIIGGSVMHMANLTLHLLYTGRFVDHMDAIQFVVEKCSTLHPDNNDAYSQCRMNEWAAAE